MRRIALTIVSVFFIAVRLLSQDGLRIMEGLAMQSRILGQDVKFSVCLPEDYYKDNRSYPVVYMLHGLGDDAASWLEYGRISQYYDAEIKAGAITPMIFIMPEGYRSYYVNDYKGTFNYQDMFIKELVPYVDSMFRTITDSRHRGLIGYSMGGFGALVMHLQHPDIFGSAVPLSISIRTDEQYMVEYAPEWDEQWGRLFGAVGVVGPGRITEYYKQNSPFYIIPKLPSSEKKNFRIYIDNGDKEETLCRSNEELHILMRNEDFPHEFRVREGGHSFSYWCSALPNALHFFSDAFESKPYRGDVKEDQNQASLPDEQIMKINIAGEEIMTYLPADYKVSSRLYPVLYMAGNFSQPQMISISAEANDLINSNRTTPFLIVFLTENQLNKFKSIYPELEEKLRIRSGYRFRSMLGFQGTSEQVCEIVMKQEQFSSCILVDAYLQKNNVVKLIEEMKPEALKKTPFFVIAPDKGDYYEGNGNLHMIFRDKEIKHEYRITEGSGGVELLMTKIEEVMMFVAENFHR